LLSEEGTILDVARDSGRDQAKDRDNERSFGTEFELGELLGPRGRYSGGQSRLLLLCDRHRLGERVPARRSGAANRRERRGILRQGFDLCRRQEALLETHEQRYGANEATILAESILGAWILHEASLQGLEYVLLHTIVVLGCALKELDQADQVRRQVNGVLLQQYKQHSQCCRSVITVWMILAHVD